MARGQKRCLALVAALYIGCAAGQPNSQIYIESLQAGGVPYKVGVGFYVPQGSVYVADYYTQCGGKGGTCNPASGLCQDAAYPGTTCPNGFQCSRQSADYWQCVPSNPSYNDAPTGAYPLLPYDQCGGALPANTSFQGNGITQFVNVTCPDGYFCAEKQANYSQCIPNPQTIPPNQATIIKFASQLGDALAGATGAVALAPGLIEYNFNLPALDAKHPAKPATAVVNLTKIIEVGADIFNGSHTPTTPPTPVSPPASPSPPPVVPSPPPPPPTPVTNFTVPTVVFKPKPPLTVSGTNLVDNTGKIVHLNGFNWFGFNVGQTMVDGLYQNFLNPRNFSQVGDFATIVYRQQLLGFNTVRLPFRFSDLDLPPKDFRRSCTANTQAEIIGNLTNPVAPYNNINYAGVTVPPPTAPILPPLDVASSGQCNAYLPIDTTLNRFLYVIQYYVANGFYVVIDFHGEGSSVVDQAVVSSPTTFQQNWLALATAIRSLPTYNDQLKGRVILDLLNEPDSFNFAWSQVNPIQRNADPATSVTVIPWGNLFTDTAALILQSAPDFLFFAEGTGQYNQPGTAYGMGFGINPAIYNGQPGLQSALGGLQYLAANAAVKAKTVLTPHCYGSQISGWTIGNTNTAGLGLPYTYYNNFAYLTNPAAGLPPPPGGTGNVLFPIAYGEYGNSFNSSYNATSDFFSDQLTDQWIHDFAEFNNNLDPVNATAYPHQDVKDNIWWDWNANSYPQTGLVNADPGASPPLDNTYNGPLKTGWLTIQWVKINNMTDVLENNPVVTPAQGIAAGGGFGLRPYYLPPNTHDFPATS